MGSRSIPPWIRSRRQPALLIVMFGSLLLSSCSESIQVLVRHDCPQPIAVSVVDDWYEQAPKSIDPGIETEIYGICCEPGQDGQLILSSGEWTQSISFDRLRDDPVVTLPPEACATA